MKESKFLVLIVLFSCLLMFSNLGNRYLDGDESITALLGLSIQENALPYAYHDGQLIHQYDFLKVMNPEISDPRLTKENLWREQPWLYFYIEAASFSLLGANTFAARFPYALIGIFTIIFTYFFSKKITNNEKIAKLATFLLSTSVTFYLFSRKARYFSMIMLLVMTTIYTYLNLLDNKKKTKPSAIILFILSSALLFHTHYGVFFGIMFGLMAHFIFSGAYRVKLKEMMISLSAVFLLAFPWYYLTDSFSSNASEVSLSFSYLFYVAMGFFYLFVVFGFPYAFLVFIPGLLKKEDKIVKNNYSLLFIIIISFIMIISIHNEIPPTRYLIAFLPLICLLNASVIAKVYKSRKLIAIAVVILMIFTNILLVFPFNFIKDAGIEKKLLPDYEKSDISSAVDHLFSIRLPFTDYLYEITHDYDNSDEILVNYLLKNKNPGDTYFASATGLSKTIMFYTDMNYITNITSDASSDWVIFDNFTERSSPRGREKDKEFRDFVALNFNLSKYDRILLNASNIRFSEVSDPMYHKFKTTKEGVIEIYRIKD